MDVSLFELCGTNPRREAVNRLFADYRLSNILFVKRIFQKDLGSPGFAFLSFWCKNRKQYKNTPQIPPKNDDMPYGGWLAWRDHCGGRRKECTSHLAEVRSG